jgi:competence protein ComEC
VIAGLSLLLGVLSGLCAADAAHAVWMTAALLCAGVVGLTRLRRHAAWRCAAFVLLGAALSTRAAADWLALRIDPGSADERVLVEGRVLEVPMRAGAELRFDAEVRFIGREDSRPRRARLAWRDPSATPRVGERWRWLVRLAPLAETRNFEGVDLERHAFRDRVHLAGRVLPAKLNSRLALAPASIDSARARIAARVDDSVADPDAAALLVALAVGLTDRMSLDQWRVFNATGTTHLVAISGLHVTMFALLAFALARRSWKYLPLRTTVARETFAGLLGLAAAGAYTLLAGFSVPAQRTWLMLAVFAFARFAARHVGAGQGWSLALGAVLLLDPLAPLAAGFWLSFIAVGVLLIASTAWRWQPGPVAMAREAIRLQIAVLLALAPLTFAVFDSVSIGGLVVNLVAIPIVSLLLVPLVLAGAILALAFPGFDAPFFALAAWAYEAGWPALVWAADLPAARWVVSAPAWWILCALPAVGVGLWRWPAGLRLSAVCLVLPLLFAPSRMPEPGVVRLRVLDAGRGSAAFVVTATQALLYDTGDGWNTAGTRIRQFALPSLDALGRSGVDLLVLPTLTPDRAAGAAWLAHERRLGLVRAGGGWPATSLPVERCADGGFRRDGVAFEFLAQGRYCVLRVVAGARAILLAGDLDEAAERALLERLPAGALASEVVVLSRQASSVGSSRQWIEAISPPAVSREAASPAARWALATGGIEHSAARVAALERWRRAGRIVLDTRVEGAMDLTVGTNGVFVERARQARYPFAWRRSP